MRCESVYELIKIYLFSIPYCIGLLLWNTVTLQPANGVFLVTMYLCSHFFSKVSVYRDAEVIYLFNDEKDLIKSMTKYVEEANEEVGEG